MDTRKQKLIIGIIQFLKDELRNSALNADRKESIEVAVQCVEAAYNLENIVDETFRESVNLLALLNVHLDEEDVSEDIKHRAENCKNRGNELMKQGLYSEALTEYNNAIKLNPKNAVYFCNRAAAHSRLENDAEAINDCKTAVKLDPTYAKAYGRMGIALSNQNLHEQARVAFQKAHSLEPTNQMYESNLKLAEQKLLEGAGPQAEGSGLDINEFINNPHLINMASQMLNDPGIRNVMSGLINMSQDGNNPNMDALLHMGQQLAQQMQTTNPTLVDNLRRRFGRTAGDGTDSEQPDDDESPPEPDHGDTS